MRALNGFIIQHIDNKTKFEEKILSTSFSFLHSLVKMLKFTSIVGYTSCGPTYIESFWPYLGSVSMCSIIIHNRRRILSAPISLSTHRKSRMCAAPPLTWSTSCCAVHGKSYFAETSRRLGNGFGEHLRWTTTNIDPPVGGHFSSPGHDTKDILVAVICARYGMVLRGREWRRAKLISRPTAFCTCVDWTQT